MVAIDNTLLSLMLYARARPPQNPISKKLVERIEDRIEKLIEDLDSESERMILPTPALSEFLIMVGNDGPAYPEKLSSIRNILIRPFDELAAIELAAIEVEDRSKGSKRGGSASPWAKLRFDRQIVAIAKTNRAKRIYSDDNDIINFGTKIGIEVIPTWNLPLPAAKQIDLEL
jgi:predicted nucleic acid-binding protein